MDLAALIIAFCAFAAAMYAGYHTMSQAQAARDAAESARTANEIAQQALAAGEAANAIARQALDEGRTAAKRALWFDVIEAVHRLPMDPTSEPIGDRLQTLRVRLTNVIDELPDWDGLDSWLAAEHRVGVALGREVLDQGKPGRGRTVDEHMEILRPYHEWTMAFITNLRHLRNIGYSQSSIDALKAQAEKGLEGICARNGWSPPEDPRVALDVDSEE